MSGRLAPSKEKKKKGEKEGRKPSGRRREEVGVVEVLAAVDARSPLTLGRESAVVDPPTGVATVQLATGLDTLAEGVEDLDGRVPVDAGVAVAGRVSLDWIARARRAQQASED